MSTCKVTRSHDRNAGSERRRRARGLGRCRRNGEVQGMIEWDRYRSTGFLVRSGLDFSSLR